MCEIAALVPVKENSERVNAKNFQLLGGIPLFERKLQQLKRCASSFEEIIISSDSLVVLETAERIGFRAIERPVYYCTSHVPMSEVYAYCAQLTECESVAWINVTNPFFDEDDIRNAISIYCNLVTEGTKNGVPRSNISATTVTEIFDYGVFDGHPVNFEYTPWARSQDLSPISFFNFACSILSRKVLIEHRSLVMPNQHHIKTDQVHGLDIDTEIDLLIARALC